LELARRAFTLIEVMVAVVIISIVIAALLQMMGNSTNIFSKIKKDSTIGQYISMLVSSQDYGFEDKKITLDQLSADFEFDSHLRRKLKSIKTRIIYTELESIDMSEFDENTSEEVIEEDESKQVNSSMIFEIGKSTLKFKDSSVSLLRLRIQ